MGKKPHWVNLCKCSFLVRNLKGEQWVSSEQCRPKGERKSLGESQILFLLQSLSILNNSEEVVVLFYKTHSQKYGSSQNDLRKDIIIHILKWRKRNICMEHVFLPGNSNDGK